LDEPDQYIDFMAKYKDWISIKRLGIREETKPEEVVHHMAGIRATIDGKSFQVLGIKTDILDKYANEIALGSKKNYSSLAGALNRLDSIETKKAIAESCSKELSSIAEIYLLGKVITKIGYDTGINQAATKKIWPYLKMPKAPGMGKGKKSKDEEEES